VTKDHKAEIHLTKHGRGKVIVDGKELSVRSLKLEADAHGVNTLTLKLIVKEVVVKLDETKVIEE
jgi:hypothetical protein